MKPTALGLRAMFVVLTLCALYLAALFGLGVDNLPGPLRPETDLFLFDEMPAATIAIFSGVVLTSTGVAGFTAGAAFGVFMRVFGQRDRSDRSV